MIAYTSISECVMEPVVEENKSENKSKMKDTKVGLFVYPYNVEMLYL